MDRRLFTLSLAVAFAIAPPIRGQTTPAPPISGSPDFAPRVLAFCRENYGKKVGDGQCSALVGQALSSAGAAGIIKDFPNAGDYVWGKPVAVILRDQKGLSGIQSLSDIMPGDVIQFRDARFQGKGRDGGGGRYWAERPHHSAIIAAVDAGQGALTVLEQNVTRVSQVTQNTLYLSDLVKGWMRIYRPQPQPPGKSLDVPAHAVGAN